jgi:hypothetical protein
MAFGIEDRHSDKCCGKNDDKTWLQQIIKECSNHDQPLKQLPGQVLRAADRSPYDRANFLKKSFLLASRDGGLFRRHPDEFLFIKNFFVIPLSGMN